MTTRTPNPAPARSASGYAYQRIEDDLRAKVEDGRLPVGTMLASRHKLAREYGVALSTAQQAISNLIAEGILESSDRRGTFVANRIPTAERPSLSDPEETSADASFVPDDRRAAPKTIVNAMLGIVSTARIDTTVATDTGSLWARQAIRALEEVFAGAGGTTRFFDRYPEHLGPYERGIDDTNAISMSDAIRALRAEGCDALAIVGLCDGRDMSDEIVAAVDVERVPVVYISWHEMRPPLAQVYYDSTYAGYQAARHLLRQGYRRLLALAPFDEGWLRERISAVELAVRHAGMPAETMLVHPTLYPARPYDRLLAEQWTYEVLRQSALAPTVFQADGKGPWGIIAPNDFTALGVLRAAQENDARPGVDFGLIGFDDDPLSCTRGLTTVRPPIEAMGAESGRILLRALRGEMGNLQICLRSQVIPRASTKTK